jgi:hypothetical protein
MDIKLLFANINYSLLWVLVLVAFLMSSCNTLKYVPSDSALLTSNKIKLENSIDIEERSLFQSQLETIPDKTNSTFLFWRPRLWYHYQTLDPSDTTVVTSFIRRVIAEPPVIYDSARVKTIVSDLENYLYDQGYLKGKVDYVVNINKKKAKIDYLITPGIRYYINNYNIKSDDQAILDLINSSGEKSFIIPGEALKQSIQIPLERSRITKLLMSNGYAAFHSSYIPTPIEADSVGNKIDLTLQISNPPGKSHKKFTVGTVKIILDFEKSGQLVNYVENEFDGILFYSPSPDFRIKPKYLAKFILFRPGEEYNLNKIIETNTKLAGSSIISYSYINHKEVLDTLSQTVNIEYYIPLNKNVDFNAYLDSYYAEFSSDAGRSLFGISGGVSNDHRNFLGGAEEFRTGLQMETDINLRGTDSIGLINSFRLNFNNDLRLPRFIDIFGLAKGLNKIRIGGNGLLGDGLLNSLEKESNTRFSLGYEFLTLINFYTRNSLNATFGYEIINSKYKLQINQIGINYYFIPKIKPPFRDILNENPFLENSFGNRLFTGFLFNSFYFEKTAKSPIGNESKFIALFEVSGLEVMAANAFVNGLKEQFKIGDLEFAKFAKLGLDYRKYFYLGAKQAVAMRINTGIGLPYGGSTSVPYVKQFYVGGPESIRAWKIRELGPGSFVDPSFNPDTKLAVFYQAADFKLEFSWEYRFKMFASLEGALFLDGGNIWSLRTKEQDPREGARLSSKFLSQIALGSGIGIRMNFEYFLLRFDIGTKVRSPYKINGRHYPYPNFNKSLKDLNWNVALNYPF